MRWGRIPKKLFCSSSSAIFFFVAFNVKILANFIETYKKNSILYHQIQRIKEAKKNCFFEQKKINVKIEYFLQKFLALNSSLILSSKVKKKQEKLYNSVLPFFFNMTTVYKSYNNLTKSSIILYLYSFKCRIRYIINHQI